MLAGNAIVVTGAGQGLGRAYALDCALAGAAIVVNDVDVTAAKDVVGEVRAAGGTAIAVVGSVGNWDLAQELVEVCVAEFGAIDGLVANAAIKHDALPWQETEANLRRIAEVNILGVQFCAAHAMGAMVASGRGGSIVTVVSGARLGIHGMSAYGATKGAVAAMTANWAIEGTPHGIRVNAISPLGRTRMAMEDTRDDVPDFPDPAIVAPLVTALLSKATTGITGRLIRFDGYRVAGYAGSSYDHEAERDEWGLSDLATTLRDWYPDHTSV